MTVRKIRTASLKIGKVIHDELKDILDIYPVIAPQKTTGVFGVYRRISLKCDNTKDIYNLYEVAGIEIAIISPSYLDGIEKAINVKFYLEHLSGQYETKMDEKINIAQIVMTDSSEDWANDNYIQILKFDVYVANDQNEN